MQNRIKLLCTIAIILFAMGCKGQGGPTLIGDKTLDIGNISFNESVDVLFGKTKINIITEEESHYDKEQGKEIITDTAAFVYRVKKDYVTDGMFVFAGQKIKAGQVVSFYTTKQKELGYIEFAFYTASHDVVRLTEILGKKYKNLAEEPLPQGRGKLLRCEDEHKKVAVIYFENPNDDIADEGEIFVRVEMINKNINNPAFYARYWKY